MEVTISTSNYTFTDVSCWLERLDHAYGRARLAGWEFIYILRAGVDQLGRTDHAKAELYELASAQVGLATRTLQTYVSAARSPNANIAIEMGLTFQHARAVLGLPEGVAESMLADAVAGGWEPERLSREAWVKKNTSQRTLRSESSPPQASEIATDPYDAHPLKDDYDEEPPFADRNGVLYGDDCELWSDERIAQAAGALAHFAVYQSLLWRVIRPMRDEYEIALSKARR